MEETQGNHVEKIMSFCFSEKFSAVFIKFIKKYASKFYDAVDVDGGSVNLEHKRVYKEIFDEYLELYEHTVNEFLEREDIEEKELYDELAKVQKKEGSGEEFFLKLLKSSADYQCFFEVMVSEARTQLWLKENPELIQDKESKYSAREGKSSRK
eukprot:snap_masked-scaffold_10-processed-gene-11.39-mRNA-1 protein AED:1.00 eAED:1.00 QI:0/-1/0/0/-1/1/1/0/153